MTDQKLMPDTAAGVAATIRARRQSRTVEDAHEARAGASLGGFWLGTILIAPFALSIALWIVADAGSGVHQSESQIKSQKQDRPAFAQALKHPIVQALDDYTPACGLISKTCYVELHGEIVSGLKVYVGHARALQRIADQYADGRTTALSADDNRQIETYFSAKRAGRAELIVKLLYLHRNLSYWGFGYGSAADMEVQHRRLEMCDLGATLAPHLLGDAVKYSETRDVSELRSTAVQMSMNLSQCEQALGVASPSGGTVRLAAAVAGDCGRSVSGDCGLANSVRQFIQAARQSKNVNYKKLP